ncbi:alpha/beta hydrolase [Nocardia caishijiensis]|uniref:Alpha-beta hydrolase superfamily lysophospholipase n=1 Tax=Nocardia caishijiensis TaxID=184756 RepID=A0ABQ6YS44_9NOCA|nr:alpha/beta hydrolase [Nocardia caishijiensis]KAF0848463.1 alpha-beta hydrolase superfamily lysophospholipase [Nocardia caishijiensis]
MEYSSYLRFLPARYRDRVIEPQSTWWEWRGRRVHVARAEPARATVRMLALHGAGGHAGLVWPLLGIAAGEGVSVAALDLPLYGDTVEPRPGSVRYRDWVELVSEFVCAEAESDSRPLVLFGASIGGILAYEVAARTGRVAHVVATCLLDPGDPAARRAAARWKVLGALPTGVVRGTGRVAGGVRLPIRWLVDMANMSLDPALSRHCGSDPRGGGVRIPLGFLTDFLCYEHTPPQDYQGPPVTLVHPALDRWTPPELSVRFLDRIAADTRTVLLDGCGHFPVEEPGLTQLADTLRAINASVRTP